MKVLTNEEYRERNCVTPLGNDIFSLLTPAELKELKHAILCAYLNSSHQERRRKFQNLACQPVAAARFIDRVNFAIK